MRKEKDARIEAVQNAAHVYAEAQNRGVDQELWDKFGSAPLKVEGGSYVPFPEKPKAIDCSNMPEGATHVLEGSPLSPGPVFCRKDADGEWRWWSDTRAMWFIVKTNEDFYVRLLELPVGRTVDSALDVQIGGKHYKSYAIQPVEFIHKNKIPYIEGCAIKYLCRWREKGGIEDLKKVKHYIDLLIEMENKHEK